MFPYRSVVEWSEEDACFIARAPAFATLATHGDTQEQAVHELGIAGALMIEALKAHGRPVPEPDADVADYAGKIALRVPRSMHARIARVAQSEAVSINQLLLGFVSEGLGRTASLRRAEPMRADAAKRRKHVAPKVARRRTA